MSLDASLICPCCGSELADLNITHNVQGMAEKAGICEILWRWGDQGKDNAPTVLAETLIEPLRNGLDAMLNNPDQFRPLEPANRWGTLDNLVEFVRLLLAACEKHPKAHYKSWG